MRHWGSSYSHQPSVRPKVSVRKSVLAVSSLAMMMPLWRSSACRQGHTGTEFGEYPAASFLTAGL